MIVLQDADAVWRKLDRHYQNRLTCQAKEDEACEDGWIEALRWVLKLREDEDEGEEG